MSTSTYRIRQQRLAKGGNVVPRIEEAKSGLLYAPRVFGDPYPWLDAHTHTRYTGMQVRLDMSVCQDAVRIYDTCDSVMRAMAEAKALGVDPGPVPYAYEPH